MIALLSLALAAQTTVQVAPNPGAPAVPGVGFVCYLSIEGQSTIFKGVTPNFPPEHPGGISLPMEWKVERGPNKFAGKRWVALPTSYEPVRGASNRMAQVQQASDHHRRYSIAFRMEGEEEYSFTMILLKGYSGLGVLSQRAPTMPHWPGKTIAQATCNSDFTVTDAKGANS